MITIRHKTGLLSGTTQQIEAKAERIVFGRDSAFCDVVFPADETLVARRHFALVREPSGDWVFDLFGKPFVAMDGVAVDESEAVRDGATIELGRLGGPSFVIETAAEAMAMAGPVTQTQQDFERPHAAAAGARRYATMTRRYAVAGLLAAVGASGAAGAVYYVGRATGTRLSNEVAALTDEQRRAAARTIGDAAKDKLLQAAYLVIKRFPTGKVTPVGTATPIAADLLGTNAHIARVFVEKAADERIYVRAPGHNGAVYEVIEARQHPTYDAFDEFLSKDPFFVIGAAGCAECVPNPLSSSRLDSYDVGTLRVAAESHLSPILGLADRDELASLAPGSAVALAGYPMEHIDGAETQPLAPTPTLSAGMVSSMTDMFNVPADFEHRFLIHHNMPITGGTSGSPIIGPSGRIVGFNNAGTIITVPNVGRFPSAALINFGQRADLLGDMLAGNGSANIESQRAYWAKMTAGFKRGIDVLVPAILEAMKPAPGMTADAAIRETFTMAAADKTTIRDSKGRDQPVRRQSRTLKVSAGRQYAFIGYAQDKNQLGLYLFAGDKLVAKDEGEHQWWPFLAYKAEQDGSVEVQLMSADKDVTYTLFQYVWSGASS